MLLANLVAAMRGHRPRARHLRPTRKLRPIAVNAKNERWYAEELRGLLRVCRTNVEANLDDARSSWPFVGDAIPSNLLRAIHSAKGKLGNLDQWSKKMAVLAAAKNMDNVDTRLGNAIRNTIGVDVSGLLRAQEPLLATMQTKVSENIERIKSIPERYFARVEAAVTDAWTQGLRWEAAVKSIQHAGDVTESDAIRIARDQSAKMNSAFNRERQLQVGIRKYQWVTSEDERVRETHEDMETGGENGDGVYAWDEPGPLLGTIDGKPCHPGDDIQCRCVAIPIVDMDENAFEEAA